ncbi:MAG: N-carbamoylputrescine amidase [Synechococcales cyanobacterium T60_A2020_003]|nr:N-carbamoylputrescine amidase [Synechococcales cyanobacterium T60_A2020_003]
MRVITVAAIQAAMQDDPEANVAHMTTLIRKAAAAGAEVVLPQELFSLPYFCKDQDPRWFEAAYPVEDHPGIQSMQTLAAELQIVLPVSFFERCNTVFFNSVAMIDADGSLLGVYRKSHIPDGPGYQEKFYFSPGDTGFRVWSTRYGRIGVGICWDQWFPEAARAMVLQGAELLLYPTAIGSEPPDPAWDSCDHWRRVMQGHAGANLVPLVASNRTGHEVGKTCEITFYGSSFIAGPTGEIVAALNRVEEGVITATFDLDAIAQMRATWGVFRDRRPELYGALMGLDGGMGWRGEE